VTAPRRAPSARSTQPRRAPEPTRPNLRVLPPGTLTAAGRRRRTRRFAIVMSGIVVAAVFGVVAAHVVLTQRQFRLEKLEQQASAAQQQYERLRLEVAQLESPERVVAAAQQLGMVPPATITYLASSRPQSAPPKQTNEDTSWANVKSHLAAAKP
jgi:cell division protein FtsL